MHLLNEPNMFSILPEEVLDSLLKNAYILEIIARWGAERSSSLEKVLRTESKHGVTRMKYTLLSTFAYIHILAYIFPKT